MVNIVAHQETSIDYPGKYAEILFCSGCNFSCGYCHNYEFLSKTDISLEIDKLLSRLKPKAKAGWYKGVIISGGEPTIYSDLPELAKKIKDIGLAVKLDTNGSNPQMLSELLEKKLIDYIAMDIKSPRERYQEIIGKDFDLSKIDESIEIVKKFPLYEFRTTIFQFYDHQDIENIGKWISKSGNVKIKKYCLQKFISKNAYGEEYKKMPSPSSEQLEDFGEIMKNYCDEVRIYD